MNTQESLEAMSDRELDITLTNVIYPEVDLLPSKQRLLNLRNRLTE